MKKILIIILAAIMLTGCNKIENGFSFQVRKGKVSWSNGTVKFQTDMNSDGKKSDNIGFNAFLKCENGHTIQMPDTDLLGYGASCPMGTSGLYKNEDGYSQAEVMMQTDDKMMIHLHHEPRELYDALIYFDKQITLFRNSPIMAVIDYYKGTFELLNVAAGVKTVKDGTVRELENGFVITYTNGITAIIIMPDMEEKKYDEALASVFVSKGVASDEPLRYYVGLSDKGEGYLLEELDKIL